MGAAISIQLFQTARSLDRTLPQPLPGSGPGPGGEAQRASPPKEDTGWRSSLNPARLPVLPPPWIARSLPSWVHLQPLPPYSEAPTPVLGGWRLSTGLRQLAVHPQPTCPPRLGLPHQACGRLPWPWDQQQRESSSNIHNDCGSLAPSKPAAHHNERKWSCCP